MINQDLSRQLLRPPCPRRGWHPTKLELKPGNFCWIWWTTKRTQPASQTWRCIAEVDTWGSVQNMNPLFFIWSCVDAFGLKNWCWTFLLHFSKPNASWGGSSTTGSRSCATSTTEGRRKKSRPARHEDIIKSQTNLINIDIIDTLVGQNPRTSWYCRYLILYSLWLYALLAPSMQNPYFLVAGHNDHGAGMALLQQADGFRVVWKNITYTLHPWRLTWNIIMGVWKIIFLSQWVICRFHVNLLGCMAFKVESLPTLAQAI